MSIFTFCRSLTYRDMQTEAPVSAAEVEKAMTMIRRVPYSLHNNFEELRSFVAHLHPRAIAPIVTKNCDARYPVDPNVHFKHLLRLPEQATGPNATAAAPRALAPSTALAATSSTPNFGQCTAKARGPGNSLGRHAAHAGQENTAQHGSWQVIQQHRHPSFDIYCCI